MSKTYIRRKLEEKYGKDIKGNIHMTGNVFSYLESPFRKESGNEWEYVRLEKERGRNEGRYGEILDLKWKILDQVDFDSIEFKTISTEDDGKTADELMTTVLLVSNFIDSSDNKVNPFNPCDTINCDFKRVKTTVVVYSDGDISTNSFISEVAITVPDEPCIPPAKSKVFTQYGAIDSHFDLSFVGNAFAHQSLNNHLDLGNDENLKDSLAFMLNPTPEKDMRVKLGIFFKGEMNISFSTPKYYGGDVVVIADFMFDNTMHTVELSDMNSENFFDIIFEQMNSIVGVLDSEDESIMNPHILVNIRYVFLNDDSLEVFPFFYDMVL